ncbi:MAG TPA: DinB family protein [Candidatus Limnocylindria bacterium]|nr:DinB family protein [Candidatus Limnocylindria bacterium]
MRAPARDWVADLETGAPDVVAVWRAIDPDQESDDYSAARDDLESRSGNATRSLAQQEVIADSLEAILAAMPDEMLHAPGGEGDWNVSQAYAHTTGARRYLPAAAAMWASGRWPADDPPRVTPGIPGPDDLDREALMVFLNKSRRSQVVSAAAISGHEAEICPMEHPLIGQRLSCGAWLLFAGVHDLMHLEQLHGLLDNSEA